MLSEKQKMSPKMKLGCRKKESVVTQNTAWASPASLYYTYIYVQPHWNQQGSTWANGFLDRTDSRIQAHMWRGGAGKGHILLWFGSLKASAGVIVLITRLRFLRRNLFSLVSQTCFFRKLLADRPLQYIATGQTPLAVAACILHTVTLTVAHSLCLHPTAAPISLIQFISY